MEIIYDENEYTIMDELNYPDSHGKIRIVYYHAGYYGIQMNFEEDNTWETIIIIPHKNNVFDKNYDWKESEGKAIIDYLKILFLESDNYSKNELMEVKLNFNITNPDLSKEASEIIKKEDCVTIINEVSGILNEYTKSLKKKIMVERLIYIIFTIMIILLILNLLNYYG